MHPHHLPIVLFLGARSEHKPLQAIPEELSRLKAIFQEQRQHQYPLEYEVDSEPFFTQADLKTQLSRLTNRIAILHFAGHSNPQKLITDDGAVYSHHIANILRTWNQRPTLIFLNGCRNAKQVSLFHEAGIPLVIATRNKVDDAQAAEFAYSFYKNLFSEHGQSPVHIAFDRAGSQALLGKSHEVRSIDLEDLQTYEDENRVWDWGLFSARPESKERNLHSLLHPYKTNGSDRQIFLSYSFTNQAIASQLREALLQEGFTIFGDQNVRLSDNWMLPLQIEVQSCYAFVLLVGRDGVQRDSWVGAELEAALSRKLSPYDDRKRLPIFPVLLPESASDELPVFLQKFQLVGWNPDSSQLPAGLVEQLCGQISLEYIRVNLDDAPYLGLSYFQEDNTDRFFGRHNETLAALQKLGEDKQPESDTLQPHSHYYRWLQIHASSGAGKSSLVRAGLLPKIRQGVLWRRTGYEDWLIPEVMMPGGKPLGRLAQVLAQTFPDKRGWLSELNDPDRPEGLAYTLRSLAKQEQAVLLVIDQFEELFTQSEISERKQFDRLLATALADPDCPFFLITTIRSDFLDQFEYLPELLNIYNKIHNEYLLPNITESGLRELITVPARLCSKQVSGELEEAIVQESKGEPGALPLVESALADLWDDAKDKAQLSKDYYDQHNGVVGMLGQRADALISSLGENGRKRALNLLLALTRINEGGRNTRRHLSRKDAVHEAGGGRRGEQVVQALAGERKQQPRQVSQPLRLIVTSSEDGKSSYVELVHEMLVRESGRKDQADKPIGYWPTLYQYIHDNRDRDSQRQQLQVDAQRWQQRKWLGWYLGLAGLSKLWQYRKLRPRKQSLEGRYLHWSRWATSGKSVLLLGLLVVFAEAAWWVSQHPPFPLGYALFKPLWAARLYQPKPEMVTIDPPLSGKFEMGCNKNRDVAGKDDSGHGDMTDCHGDELPPHEVALNYSFEMGIHEVTFVQYDYYLWDMWDKEKLDDGNDGKSIPKDTHDWGRFDRPVIGVDWFGASNYAKWLGEKEQKSCHLPTEAEWEYAARADPGGANRTAYSWGMKIGKNKANCDGCDNPWAGRTAPVRQFSPNRFGLYDMSGNVEEWVQDCYSETYKDAPVDAMLARKKADDCTQRVLRGGSWEDGSAEMRSAARGAEGMDRTKKDHIGFRVVCLPTSNH